MAVVKLADICQKIGSGATPRGGKEAYRAEGIALVRSQNVLDFSFSSDGLAYINDEQADKLRNVELQSGDVLLNITGDSVARACLMDDDYLPGRVNQHVAIIRVDESKAVNSYLLYYLQWRKSHLLQLASAGATRNALTKGMIEQLEIDLPSLDEQRKVVGILDSIQNKIKLNHEINDNLQKQLYEIYKAWYQDFLCIDNLTLIESPYGKIPQGWHYSMLGDLCKSVSVTHNFNTGRLIFLNTGDVEDGMFLHSDYMAVADMPGQAKKTIMQNDILYSEIRPINRHFAYVDFQADNYVVSTKLMVIRATSFDSRRLYHFLTLQDTLEELQMQAESRSGTFPQIRFENISKLPILIADSNTETAFVTLLHAAYNQIEHNNSENKKLSELRNSLLPQLMSGKIDVSRIRL